MTSFSGFQWESHFEKLFFICYLAFAYYTVRTKIPLVPTQKAAREAMLGVLEAEIRAKQGKKFRLYDLGSGAGGLCLAAAKKFPEAEVIGFEMAWPAWLFASLRCMLCRRKNLSFKLADFWKRDIGDADAVFFYLGDVVMAKMGEKMRREARSGCLILSNTFPLPKDWLLTKRIPIAAAVSKNIFVYRR